MVESSHRLCWASGRKDVSLASTSTSAAAIELLRKSFAALGLPEVIALDNAMTFTSEEFAEVLKNNGIHHIRSSPYHPAYISQVVPQTGTQDSENLSTPVSDVDPSATEISSQRPTEQASDHPMPELRRSTRVRHPPAGYTEQCHVISLDAVQLIWCVVN